MTHKKFVNDAREYLEARGAPHRRAVCRRRRAARTYGDPLDLGPKRALKRLDAARASAPKGLKGGARD